MERIGPFEILAPAGRGAVATVYRARRDGQEVAIKVLDAKWADDPIVSKRFVNEADVLRRLDHPNIVRLVESGAHDGTLFMALEFVAGPTLERAIRRRAFTHRESAAVAARLARALEHAHGRGVIHADITPGNVLLCSDGTPKLTDFGIARCDALPPLPVPPGVTSGTPVYMSPEQASGSAAIDARTDVYSLGAVLYESATGRAPFRGSSTMEILDRVRWAEPRRPREADPSLHPGLEECILRAMAKKPDDRYPAAAAFAEDLDRWIRSTPDWFSIIPSS
ncbi:MAG: serine/threonine protein kinase [Planctomycetes bacterium]|nr:serine/threonine protein kinase [Planctomycetota bacterium]